MALDNAHAAVEVRCVHLQGWSSSLLIWAESVHLHVFVCKSSCVRSASVELVSLLPAERARLPKHGRRTWRKDGPSPLDCARLPNDGRARWREVPDGLSRAHHCLESRAQSPREPT